MKVPVGAVQEGGGEEHDRVPGHGVWEDAHRGAAHVRARAPHSQAEQAGLRLPRSHRPPRSTGASRDFPHHFLC